MQGQFVENKHFRSTPSDRIRQKAALGRRCTFLERYFAMIIVHIPAIMITNRRFVHNASICLLKQESNTLSGVAFLELVAGFSLRGGGKLRLRTSSIKKQHPIGSCFFGACGRIRTGDLLITSELLCQLSHTSINVDGSIAHFAGAVNRFSGEESLFLLRLLPKWVRTGNDNT